MSWEAVRSKTVLDSTWTRIYTLRSRNEERGSWWLRKVHFFNFFLIFFFFFGCDFIGFIRFYFCLFNFPASSQSPGTFRKNRRGEYRKFSRYVQLHKMNKFCPDHPWQRRTLDMRSELRDACFRREDYQGVRWLGCKYRRWKISADGGTAADWSGRTQAAWYKYNDGDWWWDSDIAARWGSNGVFIGPAISDSGWNSTVTIAREHCIVLFEVLNRPDPNAGGMTEQRCRNNLECYHMYIQYSTLFSIKNEEHSTKTVLALS